MCVVWFCVCETGAGKKGREPELELAKPGSISLVMLIAMVQVPTSVTDIENKNSRLFVFTWWCGWASGVPARSPL